MNNIGVIGGADGTTQIVVSGSIEASKRYVFRLKFTPFGEMALTCVVQDWNQKTIDVPDFD